MSCFRFIVLCFLLSVSFPSFALVAYHPTFLNNESEPSSISDLKEKNQTSYKNGDYKASYTSLLLIHDIYLKTGSQTQIAYSHYQLARILLDLGYEQKANSHFKNTLKYLDSHINSNDEFYFSLLAVKSNIHYQLSQYDRSLENYNTLIKLLDERNDEQRALLANSYANRAAIWFELNNHKNSEIDALRALALQEEVISEDNSINASMLHNLGLFYHKQNLYSKALEYYERAIVQKTQQYKKNHPSVAYTLQQISLIYSAQHEFDQALHHQQQVIDIFENAFGQDNPTVANSRNSLGNIYVKKEVFSLALEQYQKSLSALKNELEDLDPNIAMLLSNIASLYNNKNFEHYDYKQSQTYYHQALKHYLDFAEQSKKQIGNTYHSLARININNTNFKLAKAQLQKARQSYIENKNPLAQALVKQTTAYLYSQQKEFQEAVELNLQTINDFYEIEHTLKEDIAQSHQQLAFAYFQLIQFELTIKHEILAIALYTPITADFFNALIISHGNLALSYSTLDQHTLALKHHFKKLDLLKKYVSDNSKQSAGTLVSIANSQNKINDSKSAEQSYLKALTLYKIIKNSESDIAETQGLLAQLYLNQNDYVTAINYYQQVVNFNEQHTVNTENEEDLLRSYHNLAYAFNAINQYKQAFDINQKHLLHIQKSNNQTSDKQITLLFALAFGASEIQLPQQAIEYYQTIIDKTKLQTNKPKIYDKVLNNLSILLQQSKAFEELITLLKLKLENSASEQETASIFSDLAQQYKQLQQFDLWLKYDKQALDYYLNKNDDTQLDKTRWISHNLAVYYYNQQTFNHAQTYFGHALNANIKISHINDFSNVEYMTGLAYALLEQHNFIESKKVYTQALPLLLKEYPDGHKSIDLVKGNLKYIEQELMILEKG
ncbi:MAG: tetratricopeptide repeat protein [Pseudomonadales bacterium]|nr:tetratricopeptide repeat protein [Pseudomonadales bacterium]